jgi:hypothetical protein
MFHNAREREGREEDPEGRGRGRGRGRGGRGRGRGREGESHVTVMPPSRLLPAGRGASAGRRRTSRPSSGQGATQAGAINAIYKLKWIHTHTNPRFPLKSTQRQPGPAAARARRDPGGGRPPGYPTEIPIRLLPPITSIVTTEGGHALCSSGAGGAGSIPADSDAQGAPSFRRWRFETRLGPL